MSDDGDRTGAPSATRPERRLPYEKPAVAWEQPLEVQPSLMAACAKTPGGGGACDSTGPIAS